MAHLKPNSLRFSPVVTSKECSWLSYNSKYLRVISLTGQIDEEGEIRAYDLDSVFTKGKVRNVKLRAKVSHPSSFRTLLQPSGIVAKHSMKSSQEWDRFMR